MTRRVNNDYPLCYRRNNRAYRVCLPLSISTYIMRTYNDYLFPKEMAIVVLKCLFIYLFELQRLEGTLYENIKK